MSDELKRWGNLKVVHLPNDKRNHYRMVGVEIPVTSGEKYVGLCVLQIDVELLSKDRNPSGDRAISETRLWLSRSATFGATATNNWLLLFSEAEVERAAQLAADWINGTATDGPTVMVSEKEKGRE